MFDFTFCPVQITLGEDRRRQILGELNKIEPHAWYRDDFRATQIAALRTGGGHMLKGQVAQNNLPMSWTTLASQMPRLCQWIEDEIWPVTGRQGRIFLLRTEARQELPVHIDCALRECIKPQLKFRFVLSGDPTSLFFIDSDGLTRRFMTKGAPAYLMDGGHPHGVVNPSDLAKITLCIGSPWQADNLSTESLNWSGRIQIDKPVIRREWCDLQRLEKSQ